MSVNHPTTCVPSGRPCFACSEKTLERVTSMARATRPTWVPMMIREMPSGLLDARALLLGAVWTSMLFSSRM